MCLIDYGGHRGDEVKEYCRVERRALMQKGTSLHQRNFYKSSSVPNLWMVNMRYYQCKALEQLYSRTDKSVGYLFFDKNLSEECITEIRDIQQDNSKRWGDKFENWVSKTGNDHSFACLRYAYVVLDMCRTTPLPAKHFRYCKAPSLRMKRRGSEKSEG